MWISVARRVTEQTSSKAPNTFYKFPFNREVQMGIMKCGAQIPTNVQDLTIPKLLNRQSIMMVGQTGTGKTLAYVAPMVQHLFDTDNKDVYPKAKKPRALIIVPTRELAKQVLQTVRKFPLQSIAAAPGQAYALEMKALFHGVDVVIGTPARLLIHASRFNIFFNEVTSIVLDEADVLCDTFYEKDVLQVLSKIKASQNPTVCVVSATRTNAVSTFLQKHLQGKAALEHVVTPDAHRTSSKLKEVFVPSKGQPRRLILDEILAENPPDKDNKTLVFTNTVQSCKQVYADLASKGLNVQSLHGDMKPTRRNQVFHDFKVKDSILVSTNLASRGLNFENLDHVILYDFPYSLADYLHRVGRTARAGNEGKVTTIVRRRNYPLVQQIEKLHESHQKTVTVKDISKSMWKVMAEEKFQLGLKKLKYKINQRVWKKKFGIPPAHNLGTPEKKKMVKQMEKRVKAIKYLFFLRKRRRLGKDQLIPTRPDTRVEMTESQSISTIAQLDDGRLQVKVQRRKNLSEEEQIDKAEGIEVKLEKGKNATLRDDPFQPLSRRAWRRKTMTM